MLLERPRVSPKLITDNVSVRRTGARFNGSFLLAFTTTDFVDVPCILGMSGEPAVGQEGVEKFGLIGGNGGKLGEDVVQVGPGFHAVGFATSDEA